MYVECLVENLKNAASIAERVAGKNPSLPILNSFLIKSTNKGITITATNLELGIQIHVKGVTKSSGVAVVPAKVFSSFVSSLSQQKSIVLRLEKTHLVVGNGPQETRIKIVNAEDFPPFPQVKELHSVSIQQTAITRSLRRVLVAPALFNVKQELTSIFFSITNKNIVMAATDSFRLSEERIGQKYYTSNDKNFSLMIPSKTGEELVRLLEPSTEKEVVISIGQNGIVASTAAFTLFSRIVEGKFPEYQEIIPKKFSTQAIVKRQDIINHVKQARIFSGKLNELHLTVSKNKGIAIKTSSADIGEHKSTIEARVNGKEVSTVVNWKYFLDGISCFDDDKLFLGFNNSHDPILFRPSEGELSLHIIMPMRGV